METTETTRERILIAEDDLTSRLMMEGFLRQLGYDPVPVNDGAAAWDALCADDAPSIALLDWEMPYMDGLDVVRRVREELGDQLRYIIMVTGKTSREDVLRGIADGADDYVRKPFDRGELEVRIRAGMRLVSLQRTLMETNRRLEALAHTDPLTGFHNRLALHRDLKTRFGGLDYHSPVSLIMADIDHFKSVNDRYGHDAGDEVLRQFSDRVRHLMRAADIVVRMGGEEFLLIAPEADRTIGQMIAERVRESIAGQDFSLPDGGTLRVTCSLGVCAVDAFRPGDDLDAFIKRADLALYRAKDEGRNRTVMDDGT